MADYENTGIVVDVDGYALYEIGGKIAELGSDVADEFKRIYEKWDELKIGWTGETVENHVSPFMEKFTAASEEFFGKTTGGGTEIDEDNPGTLNIFSSALAAAGTNYSLVEGNTYYSFKWFADLLENPDARPEDDSVPNGVTKPSGDAAHDETWDPIRLDELG